ncbi:MAG: hypothetical protein R6X02_15500 [Enhygromyxa sp.]
MDNSSPPYEQTLGLDHETLGVADKLGRWLRITGSIQLALAGLAILFFGLSAACGLTTMLSLGLVAALLMLIPLLIIGGYLLQGLRIQAAGEQFANLVDEQHPDYLELAFGRLHTVFVIELVIGGFWLLESLLELGGQK